MKIVLIRHVTPNVNGNICSASKAEEGLLQYNLTEDILLNEADDFLKTKEYKTLLNIEYIFVSPLNRALKTAKYIFPSKNHTVLEALKEFNLKIFKIPFIKLSLKMWFAVSRILWFLGINREKYNPLQEKARVESTFEEILNNDAIIIAHGFVLREIRKCLKVRKFQRTFFYKKGCFQVEIFNSELYQPYRSE